MKNKALLSPIPESEKDVHTEHCCVLHGCKYGNLDHCCTVEERIKPQSYVCEVCNHMGITNITNLPELNKVLTKKSKTCPHCGHIL